MGHSSRRQASEGLCYEFYVRAPGPVATRQHYATGNRTLVIMDRLGSDEIERCEKDAHGTLLGI